jgi:hypothetical protein
MSFFIKRLLHQGYELFAAQGFLLQQALGDPFHRLTLFMHNAPGIRVALVEDLLDGVIECFERL